MSPEEAFGKRLRELRTERNISVTQLAERMFVSKSAVYRWEDGSRLPDISTISRLAEALGVSRDELLMAMAAPDEPPTVLLVDDEKIILRGTLSRVTKVLPGAAVYGFTTASEALDFARVHRVDLALLDIELGRRSGLELCRDLCALNPRLNVVYLTSYPGYALDAWSTEACGFLLKPLREEELLALLKRLRYPIPGLSEEKPRGVSGCDTCG